MNLLINKFVRPCYEEDNFENIINIVKTDEKNKIYEQKMYTEIIRIIKDLIEKMKKEKSYFEDYLKSLSLYKEKKKKMEKSKNDYHNHAKFAENDTLYFKELIIKKKCNNDALINQQIEITENESKNKLTAMSKVCDNYISNLEKVNVLRTNLNIKQAKLLKRYEELERDDKKLYSQIMEIIYKYQKKILDFANDSSDKTEEIINNINIDRDIRALVESLRNNDNPGKEIPYIHYPTELDFNKCNDIKDYNVVNEVVKTMKAYCDKIFMDYDEQLEEKKNEMRESLHKYFDNNKTTNLDDKKKLIEYIKDERTHELFLIILSKFRINNRFCREKPLIELLSEILMMILDGAQKENNYSVFENSIIISQSFYHYDETQLGKKIYIIEYIKKHPLLQSIDFWKDFILTKILREFQKFENMNTEENINIEKKINISEKIKNKIGEILFSQLLPYAGNMKEIGVDKKSIIKLVDDIINRYNYMEEKYIEAIYDLICSSKEELNKIKEEIKKEDLSKSPLKENLINEVDKNNDDKDEKEKLRKLKKYLVI